MTGDLSLEEALSLFESKEPGEFARGMNILFRRYVNRKEVWDAFLGYVVNKPALEIPPVLIYYLAHIPWHPDIAWMGDEQITVETREYAKQLLNRLRKPDVIKLLSFIEEGRGIERGSIGQSVETIISSLPEVGSILASISEDGSLPVFTRECAALIMALKEKKRATAASEIWRVQAQKILRGS